MNYGIKLTFLIWFTITPIWLTGQDLPQACGGSKIRYSAKGQDISVFQWDVSGGTIIKNNNNSVDIMWDKNEGIHEIKVTQYNSFGCNANPVYGYVMVTSPKLSLEKSADICDGQVYTLKAKADFESIAWSNGSIDSSIVISQAGYYKAEATFPGGCKTKDSTLLVVYPRPIVSLGKDTMVCQGECITLDPGMSASTCQWSTGETSPTIKATANSGLVWVRVTNSDGCLSADTILVIPLSRKDHKKLIPNGFTPNNDNDNDTWRIDIIKNCPNASVVIYNRWGQLVYKADKNYPTEGWDGTSNGKPLPMDTYFYVIDFKDGAKPILGSINLIR